MDRYERFVLRAYALRALTGGGSDRPKRPSQELATWICAHCQLIGVPTPNVDPESFEDFGRISKSAWSAFAPVIQHLRRPLKTPPPSALERRLAWLSQTLALPRIEADVLGAAVRVALFRPVDKLADSLGGLGGRGEVNATGLAVLSGHGGRGARRALLSKGSLRLLGLLEDRMGGDFAPSRTVMKIARMGLADPDRLRGALIGKACRAELAWEDFAHLGEAADLAARLLAGALKTRAVGVNLLLHGEPGTGKTAFVRTLAQRLGVHPIFVGEQDDDAAEPSRDDRIAAFAIARALAGRAGGALLVVDEADDVFTGVDEDDAASRTGSKVFMNRLVERTEAPTLWITNNPDRLGASVMRRMAFALRFPAPDRRIRRRIVGRIATRQKLKLSAGALDALAEIPVAPAIIDGAIRAARLAGGGEADAALAARSVRRVIAGPTPPTPPTASLAFDPALSAADQDLSALADRVCATGERALSFCFHGLPGTGKSAFARHLAERLGLDVVEKRASDLLSMWVGECEKNIARAFEEAADRRAMLILDEADSLLRDRAGAQRSWEVTQVNEMLTWMERHPWPFVCTTNLMASLDPATLRRFLFKVAFLSMTPEQAREAFRRAFAAEPPPEIARLEPLAPADFAVVARKAAVLGVSAPAALAAMIAEEVAAKPGLHKRIGF